MSKTADCLQETPFFIIGNPRSGTTLLTFILSSHPRIHVPGETGFLPHLTKYVAGQLSREQVVKIINIIRQNRDWKGVIMDEDEIYDGLADKTLPCLLDTLYRLKASEFNAVRWGDKTPSYVRYIPQIDQIFPQAQFIHVIRDGRDSTLSAQKKWGSQRWYMDNYYLLMNWRENVEAGQQAGEWLGSERYLEVKYESLVQEPKEVIEKVCSFLKEKFHLDMLAHTKLAQQMVGPEGHVEVLNPINTRSVERWREEMTTFDLKLSNKLIGDTLADLGYPTSEHTSFSTRERLKIVWLDVRYRILNLGRRILYRIGALKLNRGKRQH